MNALDMLVEDGYLTLIPSNPRKFVMCIPSTQEVTMQIKIPAQNTDKKIQLIKIIRALTGMGLKDSKSIADTVLGPYDYGSDPYALPTRSKGEDVTFTVREGLTREDVSREFDSATATFTWEFVETSVSLDAAKVALALRGYGLPNADVQDVADALRYIMPAAYDLLNEALEVLR